jgi:hypothetical protein
LASTFRRISELRNGMLMRFSSFWVVVGGLGGARDSNVGSGAEESVDDIEADLERGGDVEAIPGESPPEAAGEGAVLWYPIRGGRGTVQG